MNRDDHTTERAMEILGLNGRKNIRVNAISAGAVRTRAASGIEHFDEPLNETVRKAPLRRVVDSCEVGRTALLLVSDK